MSDIGAVEILLVEDSPDDTELTLRALRKAGLSNRIEVARDGVEALEFIFCEGKYSERHIEDMPKVVLLDLKLPLMDGLEVLREIKRNELTRDTPVVVLTSSRQTPDVAECYRLGVNSYIVKPVEFDKFVDAVEQLGLYWTGLNERRPKD